MGAGLTPQNKAKKDNAYQMPGIGFFNDDVRDAVKGAEIYGEFKKGLVSGNSTEDIVAKGILGSDELVSYIDPSQVLNYVEAHDNYNLNDLLWELHPNDNEKQHIYRVEVASAMNLLMQGMAFMQLGQEFLRTKCYPTGDKGQLTQADKERAMNSYNAPDQVNQVNWDNVTFHKSTINFIRKIITLKTNSPYFSYSSFEEIRKHVFVESAQYHSGFISFTVEEHKKIKIIFNIKGKRLQDPFIGDIIISNHEEGKAIDSLDDELSVMILDITK